MKNKLFCVGGVFVIICCFALSYFFAGWYGRQFIGEVFPIEIHHQLPAQSLGEHDIKNVLRVLGAGESQVRHTVEADELDTFAITHSILEQLALLQEQGILPADNFAPFRSALLLRYSLDGMDAHIWHFTFSGETGIISVSYHPVTQRIIQVWDGSSDLIFSLQ
jgi:hypothetical protein